MTDAGKRLLLFWQTHRTTVHGVDPSDPDALADDIDAIEAEAAAPYKAALENCQRHTDFDVNEAVAAERAKLQAIYDYVFASLTISALDRHRLLTFIGGSDAES